mmetsp:Transcript_88317/g.175570  ORF Transcript_88317/g.175570 Transcript_88317/m.175570 type:complete len:404 (-) Transcript_88317:78-1289(-)
MDTLSAFGGSTVARSAVTTRPDRKESQDTTMPAPVKMKGADASQGPLAMAFHMSRTVVPMVLSRPDFWVFFALHIMIHVLFLMGHLHEPIAGMTWQDMRILTAMTTFFEVFYTGECFMRYIRLWGLVTKSFSKAYDWVFIARFFMRVTGKPYDRLAGHWLIVTLILSLYEAKEKQPMSNAGLQNFVLMGILKQHEADFIRSISSEQRIIVTLHVAADIANHGYKEANAPRNALKESNASLDDFRQLVQELHDLMNFPLPFEYVHLLSLMITLNLTLWAYGIGVTRSIFGPVFYFFSALIFTGMMDLASQLADPFGEDEADFPVAHWVLEFLLNMSALLDYEHDGHSIGFEDDLADEERSPMQLRIDLHSIQKLMGEHKEDDQQSSTAPLISKARAQQRRQIRA